MAAACAYNLTVAFGTELCDMLDQWKREFQGQSPLGRTTSVSVKGPPKPKPKAKAMPKEEHEAVTVDEEEDQEDWDTAFSKMDYDRDHKSEEPMKVEPKENWRTWIATRLTVMSNEQQCIHDS